MANIFNIKGTSFNSFTISKNGATIRQGSVAPSSGDGNDGDIYLRYDGADSNIYIKRDGSWQILLYTGSIGINDLNNVNIISPSDGQFLTYDDLNNEWVNTSISYGDVDGPASSTDNAITRFDGISGKIIQDSNAILSDDGNLSLSGDIIAENVVLSGGDILRGDESDVDIFTDIGSNNINVGASTSKVIIAGDLEVRGTTTTVDTENLLVEDNNITINYGGTTASALGSGLNIEGDSSTVVGFFRISETDDGLLEFKAPSGNILTIDVDSNKEISVNGNLDIQADSVIDQDVTTSADVEFNTITTTGNGLNSFPGSIVVGTPAGGDQGEGTINIEELYIDGVLFSGATGAETLEELSDVTITMLSSGNILYYNGTSWVNELPGSSTGIQEYSSILSDISNETPSLNSFLVGTGTTWESLAGSDARDAIGLGINDDVEFSSISVDDGSESAPSMNFGSEDSGFYLRDNGVIGVSIEGNNVFSLTDRFFILTVENNENYTSSIRSVRYGENNVSSNLLKPSFLASRSRGTISSPVTVEVDDILGEFLASGYDGSTDLRSSGGMRIVCDDTPSSSIGVPARIEFFNNDGVQQNNVRMSIFSDGGIVVGEPDGGNLGEGTINAEGLYIDGVLVGSGSAEELNDLNDVNISTLVNGQVLSFDAVSDKWINSSYIHMGDGDDNYPSYTFNNDMSMGMYRVSSDNLGFATSGELKLNIDSSGNIHHNCGTGYKAVNYILKNETTDDTQTELFFDGTSGRMVLLNNSTWSFDVTVTARRTDSGNESASYKFTGCIDNNSNTVALVGSVDSSSNEDTNSWNVTVDADNTNKSLRIRVTGENSKNIRWVAFVKTVEVS